MMTQLREHLKWRSPVEIFSRSGIEAVNDSIQLALGVAQDLHQHSGMVRRRATGHAAIRREDGRQVQFVDDIRHHIGQVALGQPVSRRRRQQPQIVGLIGAKGPGRHRMTQTMLSSI